jgi:hypothetical protein
MKIRLSELRRIIREAIVEQGWVPGRWYPGSGEPVKDKDVETMGSAGLGREPDEDLDEVETDEDPHC